MFYFTGGIVFGSAYRVRGSNPAASDSGSYKRDHPYANITSLKQLNEISCSIGTLMWSRRKSEFSSVFQGDFGLIAFCWFISVCGEGRTTILKDHIKYLSLSNWKTPGSDQVYNYYIKNINAVHKRLTDLIVKAIEDTKEIEEKIYIWNISKKSNSQSIAKN